MDPPVLATGVLVISPSTSPSTSGLIVGGMVGGKGGGGEGETRMRRSFSCYATEKPHDVVRILIDALDLANTALEYEGDGLVRMMIMIWIMIKDNDNDKDKR